MNSKREQILIVAGMGLLIMGLLFYISPIKTTDTESFDIGYLEGMSVTRHYDACMQNPVSKDFMEVSSHVFHIQVFF